MKKYLIAGLIALISIGSMAADIQPKFSGPSGQGDMIWWAQQTAVTNLIMGSNGVEYIRFDPAASMIEFPVDQLTLTDNLIVGGTLTVTGAISGATSITGADLQATDDLIVGDDAIFGDAVTITGALTGASATLSGNATFNGTTVTVTNKIIVNQLWFGTNCYLAVNSTGTNLVAITGGAGGSTNSILSW